MARCFLGSVTADIDLQRAAAVPMSRSRLTDHLPSSARMSIIALRLEKRGKRLHRERGGGKWLRVVDQCADFPPSNATQALHCRSGEQTTIQAMASSVAIPSSTGREAHENVHPGNAN